MKDKSTRPVDKTIELEDDLTLSKKVDVKTGSQISKEDYKFINKSLTTLFSNLSDKAVVEGQVVIYELPNSVKDVSFDEDFIDSIEVKRKLTPQRVWVDDFRSWPTSIHFGYICNKNEADAIVDYLDVFLEDEVVTKLEKEIKDISSEY